MKLKKLFKSALCIALTLCFMLQITYTGIAAAADAWRNAPRYVDFSRPDANKNMNTITNPKDPFLREPKKYYEEPEPDGELIAVDEFSKTYQTGEDTFATQIGAQRNTYEDTKGKPALVDNTLVKRDPLFSNPYFENTANNYNVKLPLKITNSNGVVISKDGKSVELIPQGGDFSKPVVVDNAVLYNNVYDGIDFQYTVLGSSLKEDIVLNKQVNMNEFRFEIKSKGLKLKEKDGAIIAYDKDETDPLFTLVAPEMSDASGEVSLDVKLALSKEKGKNIVTITANKEWLESPERAYPVRIDPPFGVETPDIGLYCVERGHPNTVIGDNSYPYAGYDDGIVSGNMAGYGTMHDMTRTYVKINYDFTKFSKDIKIDSAGFNIYHYTSWSKGKTNFGLYEVDQSWSSSGLTWNSQAGLSHTFIQFKPSNTGAGWLRYDIRETVNNWVQGIGTNHGFVLKAETEMTMQAEVFHNRNGANPPSLTINWSVPDPVDENIPLGDLSIVLRPITEKDVNGKLLFDAIFADGLVTPDATVNYWLQPDNDSGSTLASSSYKFPDSTAFQSIFPNGTKYKDKLSNWQTKLFGNLTLDKAYRISATATKGGSSSGQKDSQKFLIYKIKQRDTFPQIANYYGVPLNDIMRDNRVQDTLVIDNNTIFIRNPNTEIPYNPPPLTDDQKRAIDSALMGRGLHCEYGFEPINLNTGNFYMQQIDATIPDLNGDFNIERTYNSKGEAYNSQFGRRWSFEYSEYLYQKEDGTVGYAKGDGKTLFFKPNGSGGYISPEGFFLDLKKIAYTVGTETYYRYEIHENDGAYRKFNAWGLLTDIYNAKGLRTEIQYDENYNIKSIVSPSGKVYGITTDGMGRISAITLPNAAVLRYEYDAVGNLVKYIDAMGKEVRYVYDSKNLMTEWYDQVGNRVIKNTYDSEGRVTKQLDAKDRAVTLEYSANQTITTDANGNKTTYIYDNNYRTTKIIYPDGEVVDKTYSANNTLASDDLYSYTYDAKGNKTSEKRSDGKTRIYEYNSFNLATKITDFDGKVTLMNYNATGDLIKVIRPDGKTELYEYDSLHRVTKFTNADGKSEINVYNGAVLTSHTDFRGNTWEYHYNNMNQRITTTDPLGGMTRIMYNAKGEKIGEQTADGAYTEYSLNAMGNIIRITDPKGFATDFELDSVYNISKTIDPQGNATTFTYDANGNNLTETNALGHTYKHEYDSRNRKIKDIDPDGGFTKYTYNTENQIIQTENALGAITKTEYDPVLGMPVKQIDSLGGITTFEYNDKGRLIKTTNPDGTFTANEYDILNRISKYTDEQGIVSEFTYDDNGNVSELNENGRIYKYEYDANGNLTKGINPLGLFAEYKYDALNRQIETKNEAGQIEKYALDALGRVKKFTDALNNTTETLYDKNGNVEKTIDANGNTATYVFDQLNRISSTKDSNGNITNYSYDTAENLTKTIDALNGETGYSYNGRHLPITMKDANGNVYKMEYDLAGNNTAVVAPNGDRTTMEYDSMKRLTKSTDPAGLSKTYTYDSMGRTLSVSDNVGNSMTIKYDKYGRVVKQTDVTGRSASFVYDDFGNVTSATDVDGNTTTYTYDILGRALTVTDAENKTVKFKYDAIGNVIKQTDANGAEYQYAYDNLNRMIESLDPLNAKTTFDYDSNGNLKSVTDANNNKRTYSYNALNQLTAAVDARGNTTEYGYDELNRTISYTQPEGGKTEYRYDAVGNMTKIKDPVGNITENIFDNINNKTKVISPKGATVEYTYDKHGLVTSIKDPLSNITTYDVALSGLNTKMTMPNGAEYTYAYDVLNRITNVTAPNGLSRSFEYDDKGNLAKETDNLDRTTTYSYDIMHRVKEIINPTGQKTSYNYDEFGNLSSVVNAKNIATSYNYDILNRITEQIDPEGKVTKLQYDLVGNITSQTKPGGRTTTMSYDKDYNLTAITDPMGFTQKRVFDGDNRVTKSIDAMNNAMSYQYDAAGRIQKQTDAKNQSVSYRYDPHGNIITATNQLGAEINYSYDLMDRLISVMEPLDRTTTYSYDNVGNLMTHTDADGKTTRYTYDLEGNMTSITNGNNKTEAMTYDLAGRLKSITRPDQTTVTYDYDKINSLLSKTYSDDSEVLYGYDELGQRITMSDTSGNTKYEYDAMGRVTSVTGADGKVVKYSYDECDRLSQIEYPNERTVKYKYDLNDRLTKVIDGEETTTYAYDGLGRVTSATHPNETTTTYEYDVVGNLTLVENRDEDNTLLSGFAYDYDAKGYIIKEVAENKEGKVTRNFTYNDLGEITRFTEKDGFKTAEYNYTYDKSGNRTKLEKKGIEHPETIDYEYNSSNQLISENSTITGKVAYEYDGNGNVVSKQAVGERIITYEYTVESRLKAVREGGELLMAASYDGDGNRIFQVNRKEVGFYIEKPNQGDSPDSVNPDAKGNVGDANDYILNEDAKQPGEGSQLPKSGDEKNTGNSETGSSSTPMVKTYYEKVYDDPADTIYWYGFGQSVMRFFGGINQALGVNLSQWFSDVWDAITGRFTLVLHSDASVDTSYSDKDIEALQVAGLSNEEIEAITGQPINNTAKPSENNTPRGNNPADSAQNTSNNKSLSDKSAEMPEQGLSSKDEAEPIIIPANPDEKTRVDYDLTYYINDVNQANTQVLMEYGRRDELKNVYTYGLDRLTAEYLTPAPEVPNVGEDDYTTDYFLYDGRGSVAQLATPEATVKDNFAYDPFGNMTKGEPVQDLMFGYNGEEYNPVTGLQYLRARYYDVNSGRFGTEDSILGQISKPATMNRYAYAVNSPIMHTDPSGHWPDIIGGIKKGFNTVVNTVSAGATWVNKNVVQPVVNTVKAGATWVNNNVIKPAVNWVDNNIIKPVGNFVNTAYNKIVDTGKKIGNDVAKCYNAVKQEVTTFASNPQKYVAEKTAAVKATIEKLVCTTSERISNAWESAVDTVSNAWESTKQWVGDAWDATVDFVENIDWEKVGQVALIVAVAAVAVVAVVASAGTAGAAIGLAAGMYLRASAATVATVTTVATIGAYVVAGGIAACALSDAGEVITDGHNVIRDNVIAPVFGEDRAQDIYDGTKFTLGLAAAGITQLAADNPGLNPSNGKNNTVPENINSEDLDDGLGTYKDQGGHHPMTGSAFRGDENYDYNSSLTISAGKLDELGIKHSTITGNQSSAYSAFSKTGETLTMDSMRNIEIKALVNSGMQLDYATNAVDAAIGDLINQGVTQPTRIPWGH